jgi:CO/xanthine dehydrogenase Mo-binding subunit
VFLVRDGSFLAVAGEDEFAVIRAAGRVARAARWHGSAPRIEGDLAEAVLAAPRRSLPVVDGTPRDEPYPAAEAAPETAAITLQARYFRPYQMHASIGPSAAAARYRNGQLEVRSHTQGIFPLRASLAELFQMRDADVQVEHVPGPGCYGHNGADDAALDAALVARALPERWVVLKWTRDDEHAWEPYAPCMVVEMGASVDRRGRIVDWRHDAYGDTHRARPRPGAGGVGPARLLAATHLERPVAPYVPTPNMARHAGLHRNADPLYALQRRRIGKHLVSGLPLRTSAMRTLGAFANVVAIESFMDELARAADCDPLAFRLRHLDDARAREVLQRSAEAIGWGSAAKTGGGGLGLGLARYKNAQAYAAVAVSLRVDDDAVVHLERAVIAADAGRVVDRDGLAAQLEGGFLQAASWTLLEEVTFDDGGITSRDWDSYPILRFDAVPDIEVVLLDRPWSPSLGAGECSSGPAGAAICNAVFDATGVRARRLPLTPENLRAAAAVD